jgi:hypothetical protein
MPGIWLLPVDAAGTVLATPQLLPAEADGRVRAGDVASLFSAHATATQIEIWRGGEVIERIQRDQDGFGSETTEASR